MIILDVNVLLYAYDANAREHRQVVSWLKELSESGESIGLPWITVWGFARISTNPRIQSAPLTPQQVFEILRDWIAMPGVIVLNPGPKYLEILERLVSENRATGPLVTDAALAALALELGATVASTDQGFSRFTGLRWINPLAAQVR